MGWWFQTAAQVRVALQAEFSAICTALYSFEGGTCRVHLACKVQEQVAQCLMPGAPQIILVTGKETAGTLCSQPPTVELLLTLNLNRRGLRQCQPAAQVSCGQLLKQAPVCKHPFAVQCS